MSYPAFFDRVPRLIVRDSLARLLGASDDGLLEYGYLDAVKLAGHSCPTVASAYWLTCRAVTLLYGAEIPERGAIRVSFRETRDSGVTGVMAQVATLLTGAAGEEGFKGLAGLFERRHLLAFQADIPLAMRFQRLDNGHTVDGEAHPRHVPAAPEMGELLHLCLNGTATPAQAAQFASLWQARVEQLLTVYRDDPQVFVLREG